LAIEAMRTVVLACNTIRDELEKAAREVGCPHPFRWVESGLHLVPDALRVRLQEELDRLSDVDRVLLAFGFCGNSVVGLAARDHELIIPRVDDCITLLLGSRERREECSADGGVYFLTRGWLEGEFNLWREYEAVRERHGPERTERIYRRMLAHYRYLGLIDTGAYDAEALLPEVRRIAEKLELETRMFEGCTSYLERFFTGPWDEEAFIVVPPATTIELSHVMGGHVARSAAPASG
jgi:hypothetical protein